MPASQLAAFVTNPWPFVGLWWLGGALTVFIPLSKWNKQKGGFYNAYGKYVEYERNQRAYEEGQNGNNNNGQGGRYQYGNLNCSWWQYKCRKQQYYIQQQIYGNNNNNDNNFRTPNWYQFLGGINEEEDRKMREEMGMDPDAASGTVKFVYAWSVIIFIALLLFGTYVMVQRRSIGHLLFSLAMMVQYSLFMLLLLPQGVISTDDRDLEDTVYGWYGQLPVLMVYYYYAQIWFGAIFLVLVGVWATFLGKVSGGASSPKTGSSAKLILRSGEDSLTTANKETTAGYSPASKMNIA